MAADPDRIKKVFINQDYTSEGITATRLFVKGKPSVMTVDDYLPFMSYGLPFSKRSADNDIWNPILEKTFAKLNGNYERAQIGWQAEAWRILNGAPTRFFMMSSYDANSIWSTITSALDNDFMVGCDTNSTPPYGLAQGHAHSVISYHTLVDEMGNLVARLIRIRNPWKQDSYTGPWNDADTRWTTFLKSQVPFANNANDGYFFMQVEDFMIGFNYFQVNFYRDNWRTSYYEKLNDDGTYKNYKFTLKRAQDIYIGADFYDPRMYTLDCR
jgi:hypothetical protein